MKANELSMPVYLMPFPLQVALEERGHDPADTLSLEEALAEYSAWHFGDRYWGQAFAYFVDEFLKHEETKP